MICSDRSINSPLALREVYSENESLAFRREMIGEMSTECVREFFRALSTHAGVSLHIKYLAGDNDHHICEAIFKGFGRALNDATRKAERRGPTSTKGKRD